MVAVLASAGLRGLFDVEVDGVEVGRLGLAGKPDPALFLEAAQAPSGGAGAGGGGRGRPGRGGDGPPMPSTTPGPMSPGSTTAWSAGSPAGRWRTRIWLTCPTGLPLTIRSEGGQWLDLEAQEALA
jgi:hypothetical protein